MAKFEQKKSTDFLVC